MKKLVPMIFVVLSVLISCSELNDKQIKKAVYENYYLKFQTSSFRLTDLTEFEDVTILKKLTEGQDCIILCEISVKPKEIKIKPEIASIYKYDPSKSKEENKVLERMIRESEINDAKEYNKRLTELMTELKESNHKITRTFRFTKFGGEWLYKSILPKLQDPFRDLTYAKYFGH